MKIEDTSNIENLTINALVYGMSKVGKTRSIVTAEAPFVLSIEDSMLSLAGTGVKYTSIKNMAAIVEAMDWLRRDPQAREYKTICIDSITELGELLLKEYKEKYKDARLAYTEMAEHIFTFIRDLRSLPFDVYVIAKAGKATDITGATLFSADLPGTKAAVKLPYLFDATFAVRGIIQDGEKEPKPFFQCKGDNQWEAGDKSGKLEMWEPYNLRYIFDKMRSEHAKEKLELRAEVKQLRDKLKEGRIEKQQAADEFEFLKEKSLEMGFPLSGDVVAYMNNFLQ